MEEKTEMKMEEDMDNYNLIIRTKYGKVQGTMQEDALVWHNVPYGKEPSGNLRWQPPQDPDIWNDIYDAAVSRPDALQPSEDWMGVTGTEDCLNLDIYSTKDADRLPVLVFLHGGNNQTGTSKELVGCYLAVKAQMIIVSVNHRLGLFGFNCLPALLSEENRTGNFALLDIAKALDWIKENIAAFGGDPENITLSGFSAGGRNVMAALISPLFKGKYDRAVVFSGGMTVADPGLSAKKTAGFLAKLVVEDGICKTQEEAVRWLLCEAYAGINGEICCKQSDTEVTENQAAQSDTEVTENTAEQSDMEIQKQQVRDYLYRIFSERLAGLIGGAGIRMSGFPHLFADGVVLPEEGFDTENYHDVPVLMVSGTTEFSMFALGDPFLLEPQMMQFSARYRLRAAQFASRYGSRMYRYFNTDASAKKMAGRHAAPVYLGSINYGNTDSPYPIPRMGAFHGIFLAMVYPQTNASDNAPEGMFESASYRDMSDLFCEYLKNFVYTGSPNAEKELCGRRIADKDIRKKDAADDSTAELPKWQEWKPEMPVSMVFDGCDGHGTVSEHRYEDSMEKIMEDMEQDTSIPEELKLLVIRNILKGRWFSAPVDEKYGAADLWSV